MSYHCFDRVTKTARKQHTCTWCGQKILVGEKYIREKSIYDGDFQDHAWHPECEADCSNEASEYNGDYEFVPYENERPAKEGQ